MLKIKIPIHVFHLLSMSNKSNSSDISFEPFFQEWLAKQKYYLNQLLFLSSSQNQPSKQEDLQALVGQVLSHYQDYYEAKSRVARKNVFTLFSPPWFSTYERSFLWVAGFKPGISFNILDRSVGKELTAQQNESVDRLKQETRASEKTLSGEMAKIQDSIAGPTWVQMAMTSEKLVADEELDQVVETARYRLRDLVVSADLLRAKTTRELVEILSTVQAAKFLAATARFQFKVRTLGLRRDAQRSVGK